MWFKLCEYFSEEIIRKNNLLDFISFSLLLCRHFSLYLWVGAYASYVEWITETRTAVRYPRLLRHELGRSNTWAEFTTAKQHHLTTPQREEVCLAVRNSVDAVIWTKENRPRVWCGKLRWNLWKHLSVRLRDHKPYRFQTKGGFFKVGAKNSATRKIAAELIRLRWMKIAVINFFIVLIHSKINCHSSWSRKRTFILLKTFSKWFIASLRNCGENVWTNK